MSLFAGARRGAPKEVITIEGDEARVVSPEGATARMPVSDLFSALIPARPDTAGVVLPDGVKSCFERGSGVVLVHQTAPRVHSFKWIAADSEAEYGPETRYRTVRVALPYLVVFAVFEGGRRGVPTLSHRNECFFSNQPLDAEGSGTELCYPALLNCSRFPEQDGRPLSWICTQYLAASETGPAATLQASLHMGLGALLRHLLETGFNRSSENHELTSWFSETVEAAVDPRLASIEAWEQASLEDPLFVLEVPWLRTGHTVQQAVARIGGGRADPSQLPSSARELARVILQQTRRSRRRAD